MSAADPTPRPSPAEIVAEIERVATDPLDTVPLAKAMLCLDCDWIYAARPGGCPRCTSRVAFAVARAIRPLRERERTDPPRAVAAEGER